MSTILVTGGAGFIGSQLAHTLAKQGNSIIILDNFSYGKEDNLIFDDLNDLDITLVIGDIRDKSILDKVFNKWSFDYIYNIAGIAPLPDCQSNPTEAVDVNINGFVNILEYGRRFGVKTVIQASTNAMYENEKVFPTSEYDFNQPTLIYPNTKYCAERFAQSYCDTYGMSVCCLRFANVYGPHIDCLRKQPPFVAYMIRELYYNRTPEFFSNGKQARDYIYVDDVIDLAIKVQKCKGFDCVNVSTNNSYSVKELYSITCEIMGKDIEAHYNDASSYWKKYPALYDGVYPIKQEILDHEVNKYSQCLNMHARWKYEWEPNIDIKEGLKRVIISECEMLKNMDKH